MPPSLAPQSLAQCASRVFMVCPAAFGFNAQTAPSNAFQHDPAAAPTRPSAGAMMGDGDERTLAEAAREETRSLCQALRTEGIEVLLAEDSPVPPKPDAVFPNNWLSLHADGTLVLYPMLAPNRRIERQPQLIEELCRGLEYRVRRSLDLTYHESAGRYLEGTGSLVLDHVARVAYACRSERTDAGLVREWARQMDYRPIIFDAHDSQGRAYYHTNVLMWIGSRAVVWCAEALAEADRAVVHASLRATNRELIEISRVAVSAFAGNLLELASWDEALGDCSVLAMSASARAALPAASLQRLSACVDTMLAVPVPTIERVGGGSVRCMLVEVPECRPSQPASFEE